VVRIIYENINSEVIVIYDYINLGSKLIKNLQINPNVKNTKHYKTAFYFLYG
jgi:hypothetical protein